VTAVGSTPFLYPIIDTGVCTARSIDPIVLAQAYCAGGARVLQLRHKDASSARFLSLADAIVRIARGHGVTVIINDRADIAMLSGAGGVHVGQEDLAVADVRRVLGGQAIIGISTHDRPQVDEALRSAATYVAIGPIFGTATKETGYTPRGLDLVRYAAGRGKPVVAIGGITAGNARSVIEAGANGCAVITDLLNGDPEAAVRAFVEQLRPEGRGPFA
jgi:thiamine-phosphate pyrophosphorylase